MKVSELSEEDRTLWMAWMRAVFMPLNRRSVELITNKAHLILGDQIPQCLLDLCAHSAGYDVVLTRWDSGDYSTLLSVIDHPREPYLAYVTESFLYLKQKQQRLLALTKND
jgi:hypothetical protein